MERSAFLEHITPMMNAKYLLMTSVACAGNATAALLLSDTEGVPATGFGASGVTTLNLSAVGHAQGFTYDTENVGITGTLTATSSTGLDLSGGTWRGNLAGAGFQSYDYRPTADEVFPAGASITLTFNMSTTLNNGGGTLNNAPLSFGGRIFNFSPLPAGVTIDLNRITGDIDFNDLPLLLNGSDPATVTSTSVSATSDADPNNELRVITRVQPGAVREGLSSFSVTLSNNSGTDFKLPYFRVTLDGSAPATQVPEPSSALLAFGGLLVFARRRR